MSEYDRFMDGEVDELEDDFSPVGRVTMRADVLTVVYADWGGWHWQAEHGDREGATRRLTTRLMRLNPFDGFDTDWGEPGYQTGDLDSSIPEGMRLLMAEWNATAERRQDEVQGIADDIVRRSREFEHKE